MMNRTILLVEDDLEVIRLLTVYLARHHIQVVGCDSPSRAHQMLKLQSPDLVILDVMLPEISGIEFCREVRQYSSVPIIMLTALGQVMDRIIGLEVGADDYISKPFEPRELLARINAIFRRLHRPPTESPVLKFGELEINTRERTVRSDGMELELSSSEYDVLLMLVRNKGQVINRDELLEKLRGSECTSYNRSIDTMISRLRTKLNDNSQKPRFIKTVWGSGYVFVAAEGS